MLGLTFSMITISKIECLGGLKDTAIYLDSHPQYKKVKQQLLLRREEERKNGLFGSSYNYVIIDDINVRLNYTGTLPTPSYSK
jgi:hypothetical protein